MRLLRSSLALFALALTACPTSSSTPTGGAENVPKDEWDSIPRTPEWLHATAGFNGGRKEECAEVLTWVKGEASCKGALCVHGRDLSREWLARCPKLVPAGADEVKALRDKFTASAEEPPTDCGKDVEAILSGSCGKDDATCERKSQVWATKCGKTDATPLILRSVERAVKRRLEDSGEFALDSRSCDELRAFMVEGTSCAQQFTCEDMLKRVQMYRTRCEGGEERPTLVTALAQLAITAGALQTSPPIPVQPSPAKVSPGDTPIPLADMTGGMLLVCGERPADIGKYVASRKACQGGSMVIGKIFVRGREVDVRMGSFDVPSDALFALRFPSLRAAGELDHRDKESRAALEADVAKAAQLAKDGRALEGAFELFKTVMAHVGAIRRSAAVRAVLTANDEALAPALRELAKAKVGVSSRGTLPTNDFVVMINRALSRPFGDLSLEFSVQQGAATRGVTLETASFMPKATEAYLDQLKNVAREASKKRLDARLYNDALAKAYEDAKVCGASLKTYRESEQQIIRCAFGIEVCDKDKIAALTKANDDARAAAEAAHIRLHLAMSGPAASAKGEIEQAIAARECESPWW
jgi:hypothetical protein